MNYESPAAEIPTRSPSGATARNFDYLLIETSLASRAAA